MYFGHYWTTVDDKPIYQYFIPDTVMELLNKNLAKDVWKKYEAYSQDIKWKHKMQSYCSWGKIIRRASDTLLNKKEEIETENHCSTCRGKGYPWKAEVWNGRPFIITARKNGYADTSKIDWKNPDWCKSCRGKRTA